MTRRREHIILILILLEMSGCSSVRSWFAISHGDSVKPIANPFFDYRSGTKDAAQTMILRTKKGDRSVELELPGDSQRLSDFVLPVSPAFKNSGRNPSSEDSAQGSEEIVGSDQSYKTRAPSMTDHEIVKEFPQGLAEDEGKRREIEQSLNLTPSEDDVLSQATPSYLAVLDHIKQLYRSARYEAALLEIDETVRLFPTDPKLYEMRGTLLDRLGKRDLALKSWNQALRFNTKNQRLKRFIERKQIHSLAGGP